MIDVAVDGVEAITMFNTNSYDLILLDIMLPKITGIVSANWYANNHKSRLLCLLLR